MRGVTAATEREALGRIHHWIEPDPDRAPIWREAWALLLNEKLTLPQIAEALHAKGCCDRGGKPFVVVGKRGGRRALVQKLLRTFTNWTYAGWVVSAADGIAPKTIRGDWEPLVSTEDFERGLALLAQRYPHYFAE